MIKLCFATNNMNKLREVRPLLKDKYTIVSLQDIGCFETLPEEGDTLEKNSLQKAKYIAKNYGIACFSDDTGLEVNALNKAPGVYSARYAGMQRNSDDNMRLLLRQLNEKLDRTARFRTVITLIRQGGEVHCFEGIAEGVIAREKQGSQGFGYDPIFVPKGYNVSMAAITLSEKNAISHRKKAIDKLALHLKNCPI